MLESAVTAAAELARVGLDSENVRAVGTEAADTGSDCERESTSLMVKMSALC